MRVGKVLTMTTGNINILYRKERLYLGKKKKNNEAIRNFEERL